MLCFIVQDRMSPIPDSARPVTQDLADAEIEQKRDEKRQTYRSAESKSRVSILDSDNDLRRVSC
jgi:hypothetical protein